MPNYYIASEIRIIVKDKNLHANQKVQDWLEECTNIIVDGINKWTLRREVITTLQCVLEKKIATGGNPDEVNP